MFWRQNVHEGSEVEVLQAHRGHHKIENAFKNLKHHVGVRTVFLHKDMHINSSLRHDLGSYGLITHPDTVREARNTGNHSYFF